MLLDEIAKLERAGLDKFSKIHLRRGAGAYICGEESAMIESIEGKRGLPRHRRLTWRRSVCSGGRPWSRTSRRSTGSATSSRRAPPGSTSQGRRERKGFRSFSVSGRVKKPGVVLAPAGVTARELIDEYCGGMSDGEDLQGLSAGRRLGRHPAGVDGRRAARLRNLEKYGCFVGSHAVVILSEKDDMKAVALNLMRFFEDESCGQCTPCRVGSEKAAKLMERGPWDPALLTELSTLMRDASICGLGQAAPNPLLCVLKYFPDELTKPMGRW
jgi:formate dehydrogenase